MKNYRMKIKLLSDLCVSDGGVYNSALDIDVCQDDLGFPYIPAKRIKGCLRERAVELADWGVDINISELFGEEGDLSSGVKIGNAYLENYRETYAQAEKYQGNSIFHPQNILNSYTYIRTQTSIDYHTGVADEGSLRTMRVIDKGLVFESDVMLQDHLIQNFEKCCKVMSHIGMSETRGLGEILVTLEEKDQPKENPTGIKWQEGATEIFYQITLEDPMICKSVSGGETRTMDYIEGSKILGLIAERCKEEQKNFIDLVDGGDIFCSNAYIVCDGERCTEVPAYCYEIKNHRQYYVNKCFETREEFEQKVQKNSWQLNQMKHGYVRMKENGDMKKMSVLVEERSHHRRPEDKSIGRAIETENEKEKTGLYQMSSIQSGQCFAGFIRGNSKQLQEVYNLLSERTKYYMGYARNAEYGTVRFEIKRVSRTNEAKAIKTRHFVVKLEAPAIVYNDKAGYTTEIKSLIEEANCLLGITDAVKVKEPKKYIRYTKIGGYQLSWGERKPVITAFDKGTVLEYCLDEPMEIKIPDKMVIGERTKEGYGEVSLEALDQTSGNYINRVDSRKWKNREIPDITETDEFTKKLCEKQLVQYLKSKAVLDSDENISSDMRSTVSNLLLMVSESETKCGTNEIRMQYVKNTVKERFGKKSGTKENKLNIANKILKSVDEKTESYLQEFCKLYQIKNIKFPCEEYQVIYLSALLTEMKYRIREKTNTKAQKEGEENA